MEGAPTSDAPRFAASMMPGPPPVAMTLSRWPSIGASAPPRSDTIRPKRRDLSYQRAMLVASGAPRASPMPAGDRQGTASAGRYQVCRVPDPRNKVGNLAGGLNILCDFDPTRKILVNPTWKDVTVY